MDLRQLRDTSPFDVFLSQETDGKAGDPLAVLAPHPDDESIGPGGALILEARRRPCWVFYLTNGARGMSGEGGEDGVRRGEAEASVRELAVLGGVWMDFTSPQVKEAQSVVVDGLAASLRHFGIREFWVPSPYEHHPTHVASTVCALAAIRSMEASERPTRLRAYGVWDPIPEGGDTERRDITSVLEQKRRSIVVHESQHRVRPIDEAILGINRYEGVFQEVTGDDVGGYAESFLDMDALIGCDPQSLVPFVRERLEKRVVERIESFVPGS